MKRISKENFIKCYIYFVVEKNISRHSMPDS